MTAAVLNLRTDVGIPHRNEIFRKMGAFWQEKFEDREVVKTLVGAMQDQFNAADITLKEAIATQTSVAQAPLYHTEQWYRLFIRQADLTEEHPNTPFYSEDTGFYGQGLVYGQGVPTLWTWRVPKTLVNPSCAANAVENPTWVGYSNQAFFYRDGLLGFRLNPFLDTRFPVIETSQGPGIEIWLYCSEWEAKTIGKQYGGPLGIPALPSTESYRKLCEGAWEARVRGPSDSSLYKIIAGASGVPLCETEGEIVEATTTAPNGDRVVATDKQTYRFPKTHLVTVTVSQVLKEGQEFTDALKVRHSASMRSGDDDITVPPGFFNQAAGVKENIRFPNRRVSVAPGGLDAGGNREISFELHGLGSDLKRYRKAANAAKLYKVFDVRGPQAVSAPTAAQIKADVNPAVDLIALHTKPHLILLYGDPSRWPAMPEQQTLLFSQADKIVPAHGRLVMQPRTSSESVSSQSYTSSSSSTKSRSESTWSSRSTNSSSSSSSSRSTRSTLSTASSKVTTSSSSSRSLSSHGTGTSSSLSTSSVSSQSPSSRSSQSALSASSLSLSSKSTGSSDTTSVTQSTQTDASSRSSASTNSSSSTFFRFSTSSRSETFSSQSTLAAWSTSSRSSTSTAELNSTSSISTASSNTTSSSVSSNSSRSPSSNTSSSRSSVTASSVTASSVTASSVSLSTRTSASVSTISSRSESSISRSLVSSSSRSQRSESSRSSRTDSSNSATSDSSSSTAPTQTAEWPGSASRVTVTSSSTANVPAPKCGTPLAYKVPPYVGTADTLAQVGVYMYVVKRVTNYSASPISIRLRFAASYVGIVSTSLYPFYASADVDPCPANGFTALTYIQATNFTWQHAISAGVLISMIGSDINYTVAAGATKWFVLRRQGTPTELFRNDSNSTYSLPLHFQFTWSNSQATPDWSGSSASFTRSTDSSSRSSLGSRSAQSKSYSSYSWVSISTASSRSTLLNFSTSSPSSASSRSTDSSLSPI